MKIQKSKPKISLFIGTAMMLFVNTVYSASDGASACDDVDPGTKGLCNSYCDALDCSLASNVATEQCKSLKSQYLAATGEVPPCAQKTCETLDPALLFERIANIPNPEYVCYSDANISPYEYVEYIVESHGVPQIGLGMEDNFDGTWYGYYFEYQEDSKGALPEFFRNNLTSEDVQACRQAFEPPFTCSP